MASTSAVRCSQRSDRRIISSGKKSAMARIPAGAVPRVLIDSDDDDSGRVRVAVRVRPKSDEDICHDSEFTDCFELQPELRRVKLRKNNWSSETFKFDDVFTETASQKRVYEAVAKPVVESVLSGYNGTVMAYGQTGTGKTYTIGNLGTENFTERGIMVRAVEDVLAEISPGLDILSISYLQLYLESIQDLLAPDKSNIALTKDATSGEVCFPGATVVEIRDIDQFLHVLQIGEGNRHASNTKMNARSSRSHAILVVHIQRHCQGKDDNECLSVDMKSDEESSHLSTLLKSKFLIIDLAGSERIDESGVDGHMLEEAKFINLSLNSLGKCINALAENSPHIPARDSKLTRLLSDSFGGTARTSLLITVSPSARHYSQTSSTIMFGQRAMKVVNAVKLKEEYDSERKYKKFECQIDTLTSEVERHQKDKLLLERRLCELEMTLAEAENKLVEAEKKLVEAEKNLPEVEEELGTTSEGQVDNPTNQMSLTVNEMKVINLSRKLEVRSRHVNMEEQLIEFLKYGTKKFTEARSALLIELENHQAAVANPRAHDIVIWFALSLGALFGLYFLS